LHTAFFCRFVFIAHRVEKTAPPPLKKCFLVMGLRPMTRDFTLHKALLGKGPVPDGIDSAMWDRVLDVIRKGPDIRHILLGDR
jgi:hypothetical protein